MFAVPSQPKYDNIYTQSWSALLGWDHRVHRVAMATFWLTFHYNGKIRGRGCTLSPFHSLYHHEQSCSVRSSWEGGYTPQFLLYPIFTLWPDPSSSVSFFYISPLLPFEPGGKILKEIYLMTQYTSLLYAMLLSPLVRKSHPNVCAVFPFELLVFSPV
jgi:hypothetical protein